MTNFAYDLLTVDWNPEQTPVWDRQVAKTCEDAHIIKIPGDPPFPLDPSSQKSLLFEQDVFKTNRIVYVDTDTLIMKDLLPLFDKDYIGDRQIGFSTNFVHAPFMKADKPEVMAELYERMGLSKEEQGKLYSPLCGLIVMNNVPADKRKAFSKEWFRAMSVIDQMRKTKRFSFPLRAWNRKSKPINDEAGFGLSVNRFFDRKKDVWEFSPGIHNSLASVSLKKMGVRVCQINNSFGLTEPMPPVPFVLHYHNKGFLKSYGLGHLLP